MNKRECERVIFSRMQEIVQILKKYNLDAARLSLTFIGEHEDESGTIIPDYIAFNTKMVDGNSKIDCTAFKNAPWENSKGWALMEM